MTAPQDQANRMETVPSNANERRTAGFIPPIRIHEVLQANARIHKVLVPMPWLPSNAQDNTEWHVFSERIGGESTPTSVRSARAAAVRAERVAQAIADIHAWVQTSPPDASRIFLSALRRRFNIGPTIARAVDEALAQQPWATAEHRADGVLRSWCFVPRTVGAIPLRTLVANLPTSTESGGPRGRRSRQGRAELTGLTPAQREAAMTVVALIERDGAEVGLDHRDGPALLAREDLSALVAQLCDQSAARKAAARGERWSPEQNTMRPKLVGAAANLQHLATTYALSVQRGADDALPSVPAPEVRPLLARIQAKLMRRARAGAPAVAADLRIAVGVTVLGRLLTRRGWYAAHQIDAPTLYRDASDATARGLLSATQLQSVRHVWNRLHILHRRAPWQSRRTKASLFSQALLTEALATRTVHGAVLLAVESPHIRDCGPALLDGQYGLRRIVEFLTISPDLLSMRHDLPSRRLAIKDITRGLRKISDGELLNQLAEPEDDLKDASPLADETTRALVSQLRRVAGAWRHTGATDATVEACCQETTLKAVAEAEGWITSNDRSTRTLAPAGGEAVSALRAAAWAAAQLAMHDGERDRAAQFISLRRELGRWRQRLSPTYGSDDPDARKLKQVIAIDRVWRGSDGQSGFAKLGRLRDCIIGRIERRTGMSLDAQVEELLRGGRPTWATPQWATAVRNACLIHFARFAPLRSREMVRLTRAMLTATLAGKSCPVWMSASTVELFVPADIMKSKRPREGTFAAEGDTPEQESLFARSLWALLLLPGGACDVLQPGTSLLFPPSDGAGRLTPPALSDAFRTELLRYAHVLGIDEQTLHTTYGATGFHAVRALVARYLGHDLGLLTQAMVMLHHSSVEFTIKRYIGNTARHTRPPMPN